jgi:hypothetical protein
VARLLREYGAIEVVLDQGQSNPHDLETPENCCDWFDLGWESAGEDQEADVEEGVETATRRHRGEGDSFCFFSLFIVTVDGGRVEEGIYTQGTMRLVTFCFLHDALFRYWLVGHRVLPQKSGRGADDVSIVGFSLSSVSVFFSPHLFCPAGLSLFIPPYFKFFGSQKLPTHGLLDILTSKSVSKRC